MAETISITFTGRDEVTQIINDLKQSIADLKEQSDVTEGDDGGDSIEPEIEISTDGIEPELEQVIWDILDLIKERAVENESEFLLNTNK